MAASPVTFPSYIHPGVDLRVALFTVLVACAAGPAARARARRADAPAATSHDAFKQASSHAADRRGGSRFRGALVVAEVAFAMLLLVGAGLMIRSVQQLAAIHPGYDTEHVLTLRVSLPRASPARATRPRAAAVTAREVLRRVGADSVRRGVAAGTDVPLAGSGAMFFTAEGQPPGHRAEPSRAPTSTASARISSSTLRIPLLAGRTFTETEMHDDANVVIVSEAVVKRFWPGQDPIGKRIKLGEPGIQDSLA